MPDARIVVVGGGITGLAAAYAALGHARELGRAVAVEVLESRSSFGGNLVTERLDGFLLDGGPDSWVVTKPQATDLAKELGLEGDLIVTNPEYRRYLVAWNGRLHAVPEGLVLGVPTRLLPLARTRLFSWSGKARMALEPFVRARRFEGDDDESIGDFATRRLGREASERLVAPLLGGISAGDASEISVRSAFPQLVAMERDHGSLVRGMRAARRARAKATASVGKGSSEGSAFVSLGGGVGALIDALVARLRSDGAILRKATSVETVRREGERWVLGLTGGARVEADALLLAVPAYAAARMLGGLDDAVIRPLESVTFGSTATVFLGYRRSDVAHPLDAVGFVVPRTTGRPLLASTWVSSKWDRRAPAGNVLLRAFFGGAWGEGVLDGTDDALVRLARDELRAWMAIDAEPVLARVFRFERATAQMRVGHFAAMRALREALARSAPGLRVAGGGYDGVGIPDCVRQGREAGRDLVGRARA